MKTIKVVEDDKVGLLADISSILNKAKINIDSVDVDVIAGKAIITLSLSDLAKGEKLLKAAGYNVEGTNSIVIRLEDRPGELNKITLSLSKEGINIERLFMLSKDRRDIIFSIKVDKPKKAVQILKDYLLTNE